MMFCCDTGFLKKMTEATMTMTLFRQLPIECVTGDTLCRIMYDTWRKAMITHSLFGSQV
jgi:hypothetical protein